MARKKKKKQSKKKGASAGAAKPERLKKRKAKAVSEPAAAAPVRWPYYLALAVIAVMMAGAVPFVLRSTYAILYPFTINYSEDSFLVSALELAAGHNPYAPHQYLKAPYILSPYPPVYYAVVGALSWFTGPSLTPGRVVSALSTLGICAFIFLIVHRRYKNAPGALIGATGHLALHPVYLWGMMHRVDNLSLLFAAAGLFAGSRPRASTGRLALAGMLFLLSIFTKQNSVAALGVVTLCLWSEDKKRAVIFAGAVVAAWVAIFGLLQALSHGGYYFCTVSSLMKPITWERFAWLSKSSFKQPPKIFMLGLIATAFLLGWIRLDRWAMYLAMALALGLLTVGKSGSGPNYFMESSIAIAIVFGMVVSVIINKAARDDGWAWIPVSMILIAAMMMGIANLKGFTKTQWWKIKNFNKNIEAFKADDIVKKYTAQGDVILTKWVDMAVLLGRVPLMNDPRGFGLMAGNLWDETAALEMLRNESIPLVIADKDDKNLMKSEFFSDNTKREILEHYKYMGARNGIFFYLPDRRVRAAD